MNRRTTSGFIALCSALLLTACGGGGGGSAPMGSLGVSLTDSPACGFDAVNITVSEVRVHQSSTASSTSAGWSSITLNPPRKINLLDLTNGVLDSLGETPLPAGHYTQLRLVLDRNTGSNVANSVLLSGTTVETPLTTPSAVQSGIKLINQFDVAPGQRTDLLLDFDACKSVVTKGKGTGSMVGYSLMPVVKLIPFVLNGINGYVDTSLLTDGGSNKNANHVMLMAEQNGEVIRSTAPDPKTGQFVLAHLDTGTYDVVVTADGYAMAVIAGVPVTGSTSTVAVSTKGQPITLPTSATASVGGTVMLSPPDSTVVAFVAAQQTLNGGPMVTVRSQSADQTDGAYSLTLATGAPLLGQYATTLPIALSSSAQASVAGQYSVQASADGYGTETAPVDFSMAIPPLDFTLTQ